MGKVKHGKEAYTTWWDQTHKKYHPRNKNGSLSKRLVYPKMPKNHPRYHDIPFST